MALLTISDNPAYPSLRKGYDEEEERGTTIGKSSLQCPQRFLHTCSTSLMGVFLLFGCNQYCTRSFYDDCNTSPLGQ